MGYGKIFESLFTGSMVGSGPTVFAVWTYCIASAKPPGLVELNPKILAVVLGCSEAEIADAIKLLCSPDAESRTPDEEGRRLVQEGNYLYRMPTWQKYNELRNEEDRRRQNREAQKKFRQSKQRKHDVSTRKHTVSTRKQSKPIHTVEEEEDVDVPVHSSSPSARVCESAFERFWNAYAKKKGRKAALEAWKRIRPSQELADEIVQQARSYAASREPKYRKDPERWLKGEHWTDDVTAEATIQDKMRNTALFDYGDPDADPIQEM